MLVDLVSISGPNLEVTYKKVNVILAAEGLSFDTNMAFDWLGISGV